MLTGPSENRMMPAKERTKIWDTQIRRFGYYDPENRYSRMSKAGVPTAQIVELAKDNGDYLGQVVVDGNIALNAGLQLIGDLMIGALTTPTWGAAYIGVGDSNTAEAATQTGLTAATNKAYQAMVATYPKRVSQQLQFKSSFAAGVASWVWQEAIVITGNGTGTALNRKVGAWGTKGANDSYDMEIDITLS